VFHTKGRPCIVSAREGSAEKSSWIQYGGRNSRLEKVA
jgi:hypothetical protein